jgi:hypothetical protein
MEPARDLTPEDDPERPRCDCCGIGRLQVIDERPHPIFGILGMTLQTLQCDQPTCAKCIVV